MNRLLLHFLLGLIITCFALQYIRTNDLEIRVQKLENQQSRLINNVTKVVDILLRSE